MAGIAGMAQMASAISFPTTAGLYLYDTASDTGISVSIADGYATFNGTVGGSSVVISATGLTEAGGANPILDLNIAKAIVGAGSTLEIFYSDGVFGPSAGGFTLGTAGPGLATGTAIATTSAYFGSTAFGQTTLLGTEIDPGFISGSIEGNNYYLTIATFISGGDSGGSVTSMDSLLTVPDGGTTVMLLGAALSGLCLMRKKLLA